MGGPELLLWSWTGDAAFHGECGTLRAGCIHDFLGTLSNLLLLMQR